MSRLVAALVLAAPQPGDYDPSTGKGPEWGKAAPIGLLVILLLGVAVFFLLRSFSRQLKKVPASFDAPGETDIRTEADGAADGAGVPEGAVRVPGPAGGTPVEGRRPPGGESPPGAS